MRANRSAPWWFTDGVMQELRAREAWLECQRLLGHFNETESVGALPHWRANWVALVALLRAIGHVLDKIDKKRDAVISAISDDFWKELRTNRAYHPLFWDFIDKERNNVLKLFELNVAPLTCTYRPFLSGLTYAESVQIYGEHQELVFGVEQEDAIELAERAHDWWDHHLRVIETAWALGVRQPYSSDRERELAQESYNVEHNMIDEG